MEKYVWMCADSKDAIPVDAFCDLLDEIVMLLGSFGTAMYIAFKDVKDKSADMRKNKAFMIENWSKPADISLQQSVLAEVDMKVVQLNGENQSKMLPKDKKGSWEWSYVSTGRHLVRMHWLTNFVKTLFDILTTDEKATLSKALTDSYEVAFAPNHPWIVRKAAGLAMKAAPSKETLKSNINLKSESELEKVRDGFRIVEATLDEFLTTNDLKKLP